MKKIIFLSFIFILSSCNSDKKTELIVNNNSSELIDTLKIIYGTEKEYKEYIKTNINSYDSLKIVFDMNIRGIDGLYFVEITQQGEKRSKTFGYYTNSLFENYTYNIKVEKDTLLINKDVLK
jgi:hypothetical protein